MKTFLAALAAGIIGGGSALGVVALDVFPQQTPVRVTTACALPIEPAPATDSRDDEITSLKLQIAALEVRLDKPAPADNSATVAALEKEVASLKAGRTIAPSVASASPEGGETVEATSAPAVTPEFDSAVREVLTRVAAERAEERRLNQQAERLADLEEQKLSISEYVPKLVEKQAANLGIAEAVIPDVSTALVAHAQFRAEVASEIKGQRIDGLEVDETANKARFEELHASTVATLSGYVDAETAEKLVNSLDRAARNAKGDDNNQKRGDR